jgi:glutathione S-transferase
MLKLYTSQICPFAHRCRLALRLAGLEHERVEIDLKAMPDWYKHLSPNQKVPLLEHDAHKIWESLIINEYLADAFSAPLQPTDSLLRAQSRLAIDWAGQHIVPGFYQVLRNQPDEAATKLTADLQAAPQWMSLEGPFWLGAEPCLADVAIYPWFERWNVLRHYRELDLTAPPRLAQWLEAMQNHAAVQAEAGDPQLYVQGYVRYTTPATVG